MLQLDFKTIKIFKNGGVFKEHINEVWLYEKGKIRLLYKNTVGK